MKLASLRGGRDGRLAVVSPDLRRAALVPEIATHLQAALDDWERCAPRLAEASEALAKGRREAETLDPEQLCAPLPRAYQWADASAYVHHVERVRRARGAELPASYWSEPLLYQGGSDALLGPRAPIEVADASWGIDFEAELAVITGDVPMGASAAQAAAQIRLIALVNDVSLRALVPGEIAKGFGFFQSKPSSAFGPVAVTPDELGTAWDGRRADLCIAIERAGKPFARLRSGPDMTFDFAVLLAHAARTRPLGAGTVLGSGTVSNRDPARGCGCIAERRSLEQIEHDEARTPFLHFGERIRIEALDGAQRSVFGAIEQDVVRYAGPNSSRTPPLAPSRRTRHPAAP